MTSRMKVEETCSWFIEDMPIHPMLHGYERHRIVANTMIGDDCRAEVMEWQSMSDAPVDLVPTRLFTLRWTDFVANDWCEVYECLSQALSRLALLSACQESGWNVGFKDDEQSWVHCWSKFVEEVTQ